MFYYEYVDIPNLEIIPQKVLEVIPTYTIEHSSFTNQDIDFYGQIPELVEAVKTITEWNNVDQIALITLEPGRSLPIHFDWDEHEQCPYALNIPIQNCIETYSTFYEVIGDYKPELIGLPETYGNPFHNFDPNHVKEIKRLYLTKAAIFNTSVPHGAVNNTNAFRIIISVRFKKDVDVLQKLSPSSNG